MGIPESEWRNEPEAMVKWSAWLKTLEPIEFLNSEHENKDVFTGP